MTSTTSVAATEPLDRPADGSPLIRWHPATLVAFRFVCVYFLLEWVPLMASLSTSFLTGGVLPAPNWFSTLNNTIGQWAIVHVLGLPEHSPPGVSANALPLFLGMVSFGVVSVVVAVAWSVLDRRRAHYSQLFAWLHTGVRFMLGALMLWYGWDKVLPGQFPFTFDYFTLEVGQYSPRDLMWAFMGASRPYQVFAGLVEVSGGLLLLARRTAMLGALVSMAAMANVVVLDIAYDAPVKFVAAQIFLMTLFALAPFAPRLIGVFVLNHETHPVQASRLFHRAAADRLARVFGALFAVWIVLATLQDEFRVIEAHKRDRQTPLYGIWDVEETSRKGVPVPAILTDEALWRRVVIQSPNAAVIIPISTSWHRMPNSGRYGYRLDIAAQTVRFTPSRLSGATQPLTFTYVLPDRDNLVLNGRNGDGSDVVMHLRRVDPSTYKLIGWERSWRW